METAVAVIVEAVVTKSLRYKPGCTPYIFNQVKHRVRKEVESLVLGGQSQLDCILQQKSRLNAIFCSEKLLYEAARANKEKVVEIHSDTEDAEVKDVKTKNTKNKAAKNKDKKGKDTKNSDTKNKDTENKDAKNNDKKKNEDMKNGETKNDDTKNKDISSNDTSAETAAKPASSKQYFDYLVEEYKTDDDIYERVKGLQIRGKVFPISNDGSCPRCSYKSNVFVVLDFLFPAGDMPEILHYLLSVGKAVLWSSKDNVVCKDPPSFLCQGKCPADISKCGFNINWNNTDLDKIFLFPQDNYKEKTKPKAKKEDLLATKLLQQNEALTETGSSDTAFEDEELVESDFDGDQTEEEEYDEGEVDINYYKHKVSWVVLDEVDVEQDETPTGEEAIIRNMLALEEARNDFVDGNMKKKPQFEEKEKEKEKEKVQNSFVMAGILANLKASEPDEPPPIPKVANPIIKNINSELKNAKGTKTAFSKPNPVNAVNKSTNASKFTVPGSVAFAIMNRSHGNAAKPSLLKKDDIPPSAPTPTHILKGATYYDSSKEEKTSKPAFTSVDFPISKDGICPYCHSADVVYIILQDEECDELPALLERIFKEGKAVKRKKGEYDLPSFQCKGCTYGFNLDWKSTNLEKIFPKSLIDTENQIAPLIDANNMNYNPYANTNDNYTAFGGQYQQPNQSQPNYFPPNQNMWMDTWSNMNYMRPMAPMGMMGFQNFGPYQNFNRNMKPYSNYMQAMRSQYNWPQPQNYVDQQQSFQERYPPPLANSQYGFPPQATNTPPSLLDKKIVMKPSTVNKNNLTRVTTENKVNKPVNAKVKKRRSFSANKSGSEKITVTKDDSTTPVKDNTSSNTADEVDMEVDQDEQYDPFSILEDEEESEAIKNSESTDTESTNTESTNTETSTSLQEIPAEVSSNPKSENELINSATKESIKDDNSRTVTTDDSSPKNETKLENAATESPVEISELPDISNNEKCITVNEDFTSIVPLENVSTNDTVNKVPQTSSPIEPVESRPVKRSSRKIRKKVAIKDSESPIADLVDDTTPNENANDAHVNNNKDVTNTVSCNLDSQLNNESGDLQDALSTNQSTDLVETDVTGATEPAENDVSPKGTKRKVPSNKKSGDLPDDSLLTNDADDVAEVDETSDTDMTENDIPLKGAKRKPPKRVKRGRRGVARRGKKKK